MVDVGPDVTLEELEQCPNLEGLEVEVQDLQNHLTQLNQLKLLLQDFKGKKVVLPKHVTKLTLELQVQDKPSTTSQTTGQERKGLQDMNSF
jgi:hypothetical protein